MTLRLDAALAHFLAALDTKVGAGKWAMLVSPRITARRPRPLLARIRPAASSRSPT